VLVLLPLLVVLPLPPPPPPLQVLHLQVLQMLQVLVLLAVVAASPEQLLCRQQPSLQQPSLQQPLLLLLLLQQPWPQQLLCRQQLFRQQPSVEQPWPLPRLLLLLLPQPWPQQPPLKCPHKSVITKSDFLQSLPGREETSIFSQTRQFSFLLCYRQASKRVAIFEKKLGYASSPQYQMWRHVGSRAIIYLLIIYFWVAHSNLFIYSLFVCLSDSTRCKIARCYFGCQTQRSGISQRLSIPE
jgi:hypothetical protein